MLSHFFFFDSNSSENGQVFAWGDNSQGQLGDGTLIKKTGPVMIPHLLNVVQISAHADHSLAIVKYSSYPMLPDYNHAVTRSCTPDTPNTSPTPSTNVPGTSLPKPKLIGAVVGGVGGGLIVLGGGFFVVFCLVFRKKKKFNFFARFKRGEKAGLTEKTKSEKEEITLEEKKEKDEKKKDEKEEKDEKDEKKKDEKDEKKKEEKKEKKQKKDQEQLSIVLEEKIGTGMFGDVYKGKSDKTIFAVSIQRRISQKLTKILLFAVERVERTSKREGFRKGCGSFEET